MTTAIVREAVGVLEAITTAILGAGFDGSGDAGAEVRRACGTLMAHAGPSVVRGSVAMPLSACFDAARLAGATMDGMGRVRSTIIALSPGSVVAKAIVAGALRMSLSQQARILTAMAFTSRDQVERYTNLLSQAFDDAETVAADADEADVYRALVGLHAAVTRDLAERARPLPRMLTYSMARSLPAVTLANRLYGDAARGDDLRQENGVVHPLFMPLFGRALSA